MLCHVLFFTFAPPVLTYYPVFFITLNVNIKTVLGSEFRLFGPFYWASWCVSDIFCILDTKMHNYTFHWICTGTCWSNYMLNKTVLLSTNRHVFKCMKPLSTLTNIMLFPFLNFLLSPRVFNWTWGTCTFPPSIFICLSADNVCISAELLSVTMVSSVFQHGLLVLQSSVLLL